jgi:hypothetical protein
MVWLEQQTHKQPSYKQLRITQPGFGGVNIKDLDFMLRPNESPRMMNMMVKDGVFKKRYGQFEIFRQNWQYADEQTWGERRPVMFEFHDKLYIMYSKMVSRTRYDFFIDAMDMQYNIENVFTLNGNDTTNGTFLYYPNPTEPGSEPEETSSSEVTEGAEQSAETNEEEQEDTGTDFYYRASYDKGYVTYNTGVFFISNGSLFVLATYPGRDGTSFDGKFFRFYVFARLDESTGRFTMMSIDDETQIYVPTVAINTENDASYFDVDGMDEFNVLCPKAIINYNGNGESSEAKRTYTIPSIFVDYKLKYVLKVVVDNKEVSPDDYTVAAGGGSITFKSDKKPSKGQNNVEITISTIPPDSTDSPFKDYSYTTLASEVLGAQFCTPFGGTNNSRMFISGVSERYYYSEVNDPSYFPATNYGVAGYDGERITGFGHHYKDLVVFKAHSIYTLKYQYGADSNGDMRGLIYSQPVNLDIGCNAPNSIRKISNRLTWLSTEYGVCTLVSTVLEDERNVCVVSRNVEEGERFSGLLREANIFSFAIDYDGKYILFNNQVAPVPLKTPYSTYAPVLSDVYVWDYSIAPFFLSERQSVEDSARNTSWYIWNNFAAIAVKRFGKDLLTLDYVCDDEGYGYKINTLTNSQNDFGRSIEAYYQTPMFDFGDYGYLKTVKKMYVQCRGGITFDTQVRYMTDDNELGEEEPENLASVVASFWDNFTWDTMTWGENTYANTYARKCSLKKVEMAGLYFYNNMANYDMPINGIQLLYTLVKEIK